MPQKSLTNSIINNFGSRKVFFVYLICNFITAGTLIATIVTSLVSGTVDKMIEHGALCILAITLTNLPIIMRHKINLRIPSFLQIIVTLFILAHFILGEIFRFYDFVFLYDKVLHTTSGVVIAACGFSIVYGYNYERFYKMSAFFTSFFSFCFALAIAVIWEIYEFAMDVFFGRNMQRYQDSLDIDSVEGYWITISRQGSGLIDTMSDLIVSTIGALIICIIGYIYLKRGKVEVDKFLIVRERTQKHPAAKPAQRAQTEPD